ncbi:MAG TPA: glutamate-1-semialdehyde 2,1-aminomutase [bacterium]|nr:glutamate-1-semialdehyde 2,1-aminomutase [bacterium]
MSGAARTPDGTRSGVPDRAPATRSETLYAEACRLMPGGVNSPVRAYRAVGGVPPFLVRGAGARVWDTDGREYVDYVASWGPLIAGHAHPAVVRGVVETTAFGSSFGAPTPLELAMARAVTEAIPSIEMVRMVSSGTEATMSALRVARAATGRRYVVKFDGCYHGHADALLVKAGSGMMTLAHASSASGGSADGSVPASAGVPEELAALTLVLPFNDAEAARAAFQRHGAEIAGVIVEPVAGNMGVVPPAPGFLESLRDLCRSTGAVLIFDEVITGFRVARGGAQARYHLRADLTCLGKVIGGGFPVGAYGGRRDVMQVVAPLGPAYQAGTLSGNPVAMRAGLETLQLLDDAAYRRLDGLGAALADGLSAAARRAGVPLVVNRVGSMLTPFCADAPVTDAASAQRADTARYARLFHGLLARGIMVPPSQFEAWFVSLAHTVDDVRRTADAAAAAFAA